MSKIFKTKINKNKITYGLSKDETNNTFGVFKLHENYCRGKMVKSWRYIEKNMTQEDAEKLFDKRTK